MAVGLAGHQGIDLVHGGCALALESEVFFSFDERRAELAKAGALEAPLIAGRGLIRPRPSGRLLL